MGIDIQEAIHAEGTTGPPVLPDGSRLHTQTHPGPERSETGVWIGILAIVMSFAAFTSAMIVRQGVSPDWRHFALPRILYGNTLILLFSSFTLRKGTDMLQSVARASSMALMETKRTFSEGMNWLQVTLALGGLFLVGQVLAWRALTAQGLFLSTNPSSSFFFVFTAMHGVHLLGGIAAIIYMIRKLGNTNGTAKTTGLRALSVYWHFMDGLWLYLLMLLLIRT
ncbi:MAG: cytochrome c oxidase subunit 3 [Acidobacteria bacterium]|nr:cytochrome c oxidase subunit 3 [Acidobacteriota bacterium]MBS1865553.1 cytochrome c oxidase subunit 3 [Acidobacteriota bacterium]